MRKEGAAHRSSVAHASEVQRCKMFERNYDRSGGTDEVQRVQESQGAESEIANTGDVEVDQEIEERKVSSSKASWIVIGVMGDGTAVLLRLGSPVGRTEAGPSGDPDRRPKLE